MSVQSLPIQVSAIKLSKEWSSVLEPYLGEKPTEVLSATKTGTLLFRITEEKEKESKGNSLKKYSLKPIPTNLAGEIPSMLADKSLVFIRSGDKVKVNLFFIFNEKWMSIVSNSPKVSSLKIVNDSCYKLTAEFCLSMPKKDSGKGVQVDNNKADSKLADDSKVKQ